MKLQSNAHTILERYSSYHSAHLSSMQMEMDSLSDSFLSQASDGRQLLAMTVGSGVFQGVRMAAHALGMGRVLSWGLALGGESAAFGLMNRGLHGEDLFHHGFENWRRDCAHFGILKAVGTALGRQGFVLSHASQALGMMWGMDVTTALGWTPREEGNFSQRFVNALTMSLSMEAGGYLWNSVIGKVTHKYHVSEYKYQEFLTSDFKNREILWMANVSQVYPEAHEIRTRVRQEFEAVRRNATGKRTLVEIKAEAVADQMWDGVLNSIPLRESGWAFAKVLLRFGFEVLKLRHNGYRNSSESGRLILKPFQWRCVESEESQKIVEEAHVLAESDPTRPRGLFVLSNHTSFFDFAKFMAEDPLARFGVGDFLYEVPLLKDVLKIAGHFRITRQRGMKNDPKVSERAITELREGIDKTFASGNHVYLFPEGALSAEGGLGFFKMGAAHEAFRRGNYVLIRVVNGFGQMWKNFEDQRNPEAKVSRRLPLNRPIVTESALLDPRKFADEKAFHEAICEKMLSLYMKTLDRFYEMYREGDVEAGDQIRVLLNAHRPGLDLLRQGREEEARAWCDNQGRRQKVNYEFLRKLEVWERKLRRHLVK